MSQLAKKSRPNILFLMTDEQRFDTVGYVNPAVKTPHLDALARESVVFTRAYSTNPSCVPARAAIFTGKYPSQCAAPTFLTHLPETETTFMALLRASGYRTAVIGKQHFGETRIERGHDYEEIVDTHGPAKSITPTADNGYDRFLAGAGFSAGEQLCQAVNSFAYRWIAEDRYHIDDFIGERGERWIAEEAPADQPWFCCISFPGPHMPFDGLGLSDDAQYRDEAIDLPTTTYADLDGKPAHYREQILTGHGSPGTQAGTPATEEEIRTTRRAYYANMSLIDRKIGAILQALKARGQYDDTLILFTSDHGDFMGDFGMIGKGQYLAEAVMRIPFLIKPPAANHAGRHETALISSVDIGATCLAAAQVPIPEAMESADLAPFWQDPDGATRARFLYCEAQNLRSIRCDRWKVIYYANRTYGELYDLVTDPEERRNRWDDPACREEKERLLGELINRLLALEPRAHMPWNVGAPTI